MNLHERTQFRSASLLLLALPLAPAQTGPCEHGRALLQDRSYAAAQEPLWRCVLDGAPGREPAHLLTQTYRELGNHQEGKKRLQTVLEGRSPSVDLLYLGAFFEFRLRNHQSSLDLLARAYELDNYDWRVHYLFALNYIVLHVKQGDLEGLQRAAALNPANPELHYLLARVHFTEQRFPESIAASHKALALFPEYPEVYNNLALCYQAMADDPQAGANFEPNAVTDPEGASLPPTAGSAERDTFWWLAGCSFVPVVAVIVAGWLVNDSFWFDRYFIFVAPFYLALVAASVYRLRPAPLRAAMRHWPEVFAPLR